MRTSHFRRILVLLATISSLYCTENGKICTLPTSNLCEISEMKFKLEKVINYTNKVIDTLSGGADAAKCPVHPEDCEALYRCGIRSSGVHSVWPRSRIIKNTVQVYCDMQTDGGAWTVFQRRGNFGRAKDYFYNDWISYKEGFGQPSQDFWLGNDIIFALTNQKLNTLRIDLRDLEGESRHAVYDKFWIDSEDYNFTLRVQGYTGNAGDSFSSHSGRQFTTKDRDNDLEPASNCAVTFKGAWWYVRCHVSNLNGLYLNGSHTTFADGIEWHAWRGYNYSLPFTEMKMRPLFFKANETLYRN